MSVIRLGSGAPWEAVVGYSRVVVRGEAAWVSGTTAVVDGTVPDELVVTRTIRRQLIDMPGRLVNRSGTATLRLPTNWPWRHSFTRALDALRAVPAVPV